MAAKTLIQQTLLAENASLRARLEEAEESEVTLRAIRCGEVDALVVESPAGPQIFTLQGVEAESNRFRGELLSQVSEAVVAVDRYERVTYLNAAAEVQYGVTASEILGCRKSEIYRLRWFQPGDEAAAYSALREHGVWRGDNIHLTRDGRELHVASSITVVRDRSGAPAGQIRVLRDVTERRRAEEQIRCLNHALESRVIERTAALRAAVDSLESEIAERQRLEREILEISEHEKARVGQDLHDGLCQTLTGIALIAKVLQRNLEDEKLSLAAASADTKTIVSLVKDAISEARNLATEMYPVNIEEYGLAPALEKLTASMANRFRNTCRFKCPEPVELADNQVAAHLYRITQEAVSNASNHGDASMVVVTFAAAGDRVTLTIEDNGNGRLKNLKSTGMGLKTMDYRARAIGGSLEIKQRPRFGLAIICTFPNRQRKDV